MDFLVFLLLIAQLLLIFFRLKEEDTVIHNVSWLAVLAPVWVVLVLFLCVVIVYTRRFAHKAFVVAWIIEYILAFITIFHSIWVSENLSGDENADRHDRELSKTFIPFILWTTVIAIVYLIKSFRE